MMLPFVKFECEVTGEGIRHKVAARIRVAGLIERSISRS